VHRQYYGALCSGKSVSFLYNVDGNNIIEDFLFATSAKEELFLFSDVIGYLSINLFKIAP
jgi:hypothetical protein